MKTIGKAALATIGALIVICVVGGVLVSLGTKSDTKTATITRPSASVAASSASVAASADESAAASSASAAAVGPTAEPTAEPSTAPVAKVGDRVELNGTALTVNDVKHMQELSTYEKADAGKEYVAINVTIENTGNDKIPYNPLYFKLKDADGYEYSGALTIADQSLKSGELLPGDKTRGLVAFEVPSGAAGLIVTYKPITFGNAPSISVHLD